MSISQRCPFCESHDVRPLIVSGVDITGYLCHDCSKAFYAAVVKLPTEVVGQVPDERASPSDQIGPTQVPRKRARRPS